MRVCVVGGGKVGFYLSKTLMEHGHEPIMIEIDEHACARLADNLDFPVVHGDGTLVEILELAKIGNCQALIGVTGRDESNLIACQLAKKVFGVKKTVARVNNPKNARVLKQLGVDSTVLRRVAVASYEAELNLIIHSLGGQLTMEMNPEHIVLISKDVGPGIADIDKAMQEGFSTASEEARVLGFGAGMGLPNMRRNADGFAIESQPGVGTTIQMEFRLK